MNSDVVRWPRCLWCYSCCNCCYCNDNDNDTKFVWQQRKRQSIVEQGSCNQRQSTRIASTTTNTTNMMIKRCTFVDFSDIVHSVIKSNFIFKLICVWLVINLNLITIVVGESDFAAPLADQLSSPSTSSSALSAAAAEPSSMGIERNRNSIAGHYTSTWAVHIPDGDEIMVNRIATDHGFINLGKIIDGYYHFHHESVLKRSIYPAHRHHGRLVNDPQVRWAMQQTTKSRQKRDFIRLRQSRTSLPISLNDPKWPQMWYLNRGNGFDMNVIPAWREGITGKGVVVTILDDGLESDHPDLEQNYDPKASYDVNSHDDDPMPHYDMTDSNRHGTRCAGEVAATANNSICAVGIAYGAKVGGVRMLDGDVTDAVEARSLSLNPQHIDIYSASWGPDDDGKTVDGPGEMATRAFIEGVTNGRNGKGSIFIWASGNGGREHDNCNCDGYTNSIWTLSISSATEDGLVPWYSEKCSSTLATTYSSGGSGEKQVITTDLHHTCTASHTGTSASAPLAAGIAALVLEANRNLTWRDLQHIVVRTAKPGNLKDPTWTKNGVGRRVSHSFGYGLMDAAAMVKIARTWKTVPEQQRCEINAPHLDKSIPPKSHLMLQLPVQHCKGVNYLEHVQAKITLTSPRRGDLQIYLKSPAGTKVTLLTSRSYDTSRSGFNQWPFMSVHTWGEAPHGNWQLEIHNEGRFMAQITQWDVIFHGTEKPPQPNDPPRYEKTELDDEFGNDFVHNSLDFDSDSASGQWRDTHEIGESHVDVQRTASNDQTGSACLHFSPDQKCIECLQSTFLYEGRCYTSCPERSYIVPENLWLSKVTTANKHAKIFLTNNTNSAPIRSALSLRQINKAYLNNSQTNNNNNNNSAMVGGMVNNLSRLFQSYNSQYHRDRRAIIQSIPQKLCATCHYSCLKCRGPNDYDCTACAPDAVFSAKAFNESYCVSNHQQIHIGDDHILLTTTTSSTGKNISIVLLIAGAFASIIFVIVAMILIYLYRTKYHTKTIPQYTYNKINYDGLTEQTPFPPELYGNNRSSISSSSSDSSDSDDEDSFIERHLHALIIPGA